MQYNRYSIGPDNHSIDKLKVWSMSIVIEITKLFCYFGADIVFKLRYKIE